MAFILFAFSAVLYRRTHRQLTAEIDTYLDERIDRLVAQMELEKDQIVLHLTLVDPDPNLLWQIKIPSGRVLHRSGPYRDLKFDAYAEHAREHRQTKCWTQSSPGIVSLRLGARRFIPAKARRLIEIKWRDPAEHAEVTEIPAEREDDVPAFTIHVGKSLGPRNAALRRLLVALLVAVPAGLVVLAVGGVVLVGRPLNLVDAITKAAAKVKPEELSTRVPLGDANDEIGRLAQVINNMLDRIDEGFRREMRFASDASHELRTPLTALRGELEVALRRSRSAEEYREVLEHGLQEVERMARIVEGLLFLARVDAGRVKHEAADMDLTSVLRRSVELASRLPGPVGTTALSGRPGSHDIRLPSPEHGPMMVFGNRELLERLFVNLLDNGMKHGREPINLQVYDKDRSWTVAVADSGPGITEEHLPHIFDRFYRADKSRSRATGGAGLGLPICRWVVEAHGGTITARNDPHGGAVFVVALPRAGASV